MTRKRKLTRKDFIPEPTPVWTKIGAEIEPTPFFRNWWKNVAEQRSGNREHWLDAAIQLGYVWRYREPSTGELHHDPIGFDYDPVLYRESLNIPEDMPLVHQDESRHDEYERLWKLLLSEDKEKASVPIYDNTIDVVEPRKRVGMVFQKPNPFPMSVFENVAFGPRRHGEHNLGELEDIVERSLRQAALWDEVKDKLRQSALALSGGQQQRLCIARVLVVEPEVILMDEPCSALDPVATLKIEDLMRSLAQEYSIAIVTHSMQQAARVSDMAAFLMMAEDRAGVLVEYGPTSDIFTNPKEVVLMQAYCMKCRTKREMKDAKAITMKNGKPATQGVCPSCGTKMFRIGKS